MQEHEKIKEISTQLIVNVIQPILVLEVHDIWGKHCDSVEHIAVPPHLFYLHNRKYSFLPSMSSYSEVGVTDDIRCMAIAFKSANQLI